MNTRALRVIIICVAFLLLPLPCGYLSSLFNSDLSQEVSQVCPQITCCRKVQLYILCTQETSKLEPRQLRLYWPWIRCFVVPYHHRQIKKCPAFPTFSGDQIPLCHYDVPTVKR